MTVKVPSSEARRAEALLVDRALIRQLVDDWVVWRDSGDWKRFRTLWHPTGRMHATWLQGGFEDFVVASRRGMEDGVQILHFLGGCSAEVSGERAISQTKMTISQRAEVHDVLSDVVCTGRFYDFLTREPDGWKLVLRQPIYERDRLDAVAPGATLELDERVLREFPEGYRHLAYLQTQIGFNVKRDMPGLRGPGVEALYRRGAAWLAGEALDDAG